LGLEPGLLKVRLQMRGSNQLRPKFGSTFGARFVLEFRVNVD